MITFVDKNILLQLLAHGKIVDIGCFDGAMFGDKAVNVDIQKIKEGIPNFVQADANNLPFQDNEFDFAVLGELLEHMDDPVQTLKEASRVARCILFSVPNEHEWDPEHKPFCHPHHKHFFNQEKIMRLIADSNLTLLELIKVNFAGWSHFVVFCYSPSKIQFKII